jgi:hypothetical protein
MWYNINVNEIKEITIMTKDYFEIHEAEYEEMMRILEEDEE